MVTVSSGFFMNGMPAQDEVNINFDNGVCVTLTRENYYQLAQAIEEKIGKDLEKVQAIDSKYWKRSEKVNELIKDIRDVFYNDLDDWATQKPIKEIDPKKLDQVLEKHKEILGFE